MTKSTNLHTQCRQLTKTDQQFNFDKAKSLKQGVYLKGKLTRALQWLTIIQKVNNIIQEGSKSSRKKLKISIFQMVMLVLHLNKTSFKTIIPMLLCQTSKFQTNHSRIYSTIFSLLSINSAKFLIGLNSNINKKAQITLQTNFNCCK